MTKQERLFGCLLYFFFFLLPQDALSAPSHLGTDVYLKNYSEIIYVDGVGDEAQGADVAFIHLDANPRPEMILMAYDNPPGPNEFRYRIGWNLDIYGHAAQWSNVKVIPGVGDEAQGAGIAIGYIDNNSRPDMVVMAFDNPPGENEFRYRIAWNFDENGNPASYSDIFHTDGFGNWEGEAADVALVNIDNNQITEIVLTTYDKADYINLISFKIGWNYVGNSTGLEWSKRHFTGLLGTIGTPDFADHVQGSSLDFYIINDNSELDQIKMVYANPPGANEFRFKICWDNYMENGELKSKPCTPIYHVPGVGDEAQGAGMDLIDLDRTIGVSPDPRLDMVLMAYDNPPGRNTFRYRIVRGIQEPVYEDVDKEFAGYVSDEEDRFVGYVHEFVDEFGSTESAIYPVWSNSQYYWAECRFFKAESDRFANSVDLVYVAGHGSASSITLSGGEKCSLENIALGSFATNPNRNTVGDLEYIVFHSCSVLEMDNNWRSRWRKYELTKNDPKPFSGLRIAMGFRTTHGNGIGAGGWTADEFAENLKDGFTVVDAWYEAVEDGMILNGWSDNKAAIFYTRPHRYDVTYIDVIGRDYQYGDPEYLLDAIYME